MLSKQSSCFDLFLFLFITIFFFLSLVIQSGNTQTNTRTCQKCLKLDNKHGFLSFKNKSDDYEYDCDAQFPGKKIREQKCSNCRLFFETTRSKRRPATWAKLHNCHVSCSECCRLHHVYGLCPTINSTHCEYNCHKRFEDFPIRRLKCQLCDKCLPICILLSIRSREKNPATSN